LSTARISAAGQVVGDLDVGLVWQVFTYAAVNDISPSGVIWTLLSLLFLWFAYAPFEDRFGGRRTLQLVAVCVLAGGIPALIVGLILPGILVGPGPMLLGGIAAFAWSLPRNASLSF